MHNKTKVEDDEFHLSATEIQIKTWSVQQILAPLILQVTDLMDRRSESPALGSSCRSLPTKSSLKEFRRTPSSPKRLLADLVKAINDLCDRALTVFGEIDTEYQRTSVAETPKFKCLKSYFKQALSTVEETGAQLVLVGKGFLADPLDVSKREQVTGAARPLLFAVARLLTVIDSMDVDLLAKEVKEVSCFVTKADGLMRDGRLFEDLVEQVAGVCDRAADREAELISEADKDRLAILRFRIGKQMRLVCHAREASAVQLNSDFVRALVSSLDQMAADLAETPPTEDDAVTPLMTQIEVFESLLDGENPKQHIEGELERIIRRIGMLADQPWVHAVNRRDLVAVCNDARQTLQDFLAREYDSNYVEKVCDRIKSLLRQLLASRCNDLATEIDPAVDDIRENLQTERMNEIVEQFVNLTQSATQILDAKASSQQRYIQLAADELQIFHKRALTPAIRLAASGKCPTAEKLVEECLAFCERLLLVIRDCINQKSAQNFELGGGVWKTQ